jgi:hypothetical protein
MSGTLSLWKNGERRASTATATISAGSGLMLVERERRGNAALVKRVRVRGTKMSDGV